jgi:chromosome partitioning protein
MRTIAFLTKKGGVGKTTLAASVAVAAASDGEKVIALDLDPQALLLGWAQRRAAASIPNTVLIEPLEHERLPRLNEILEGLAGVGFTLAVFDTAGADNAATRLVAQVADLCLLPARPTVMDVESTAATFRIAHLAKRRAAFILNQCPTTYRSSRAIESAEGLTRLGVLAEPMVSTRVDFQDAIGAGLGVTEYAPEGRAAQETRALWCWIREQLDGVKSNAAKTINRGQLAAA